MLTQTLLRNRIQIQIVFEVIFDSLCLQPGSQTKVELKRHCVVEQSEVTEGLSRIYWISVLVLQLLMTDPYFFSGNAPLTFILFKAKGPEGRCLSDACCCCVPILLTTFPRTSAERIHSRGMGRRASVQV